MRVLLDLPLTAGGVGRYAHDLSEGLEAVDPGLQMVVMCRPTFASIDRAFTPWGRGSVALRAAAVRPDVIHGLHLELPPGRRPMVVTIPDLIPLQFPLSMPKRSHRTVFERIIRRSIARASAVIVPSVATEQALRSHGLPIDKVTVIPHGVGAPFRPVGEDERASARRRFAAGAPYVACVGSGRPHKNMPIVHEVAPLLAEDGVSLVVAGSYVPERAEGPGPNLHILGPLSDADLVVLLSGAEALLMPSFVEGFGLPALEAIACGTPVVCGRGLGALPYIREAAVEVDVSDPDSLAAALGSLVASPLRRQLSHHARILGSELSVPAMCGRTLDVYRRVLG